MLNSNLSSGNVLLALSCGYSLFKTSHSLMSLLVLNNWAYINDLLILKSLWFIVKTVVHLDGHTNK